MPPAALEPMGGEEWVVAAIATTGVPAAIAAVVVGEGATVGAVAGVAGGVRIASEGPRIDCAYTERVGARCGWYGCAAMRAAW